MHGNVKFNDCILIKYNTKNVTNNYKNEHYTKIKSKHKKEYV